jgi:hypothetical protein
LIVGAFAIAVVGWLITRSEPPPLQAPLADGRILQIEAVTFGTNHEVGRKSVLLQRFGPWLPAVVREYLTPKWPYAQIRRARPGLVVWVNALDAVTGTNVDCQGVRVEFVDKHGDLYGTETSHWFGGQKFWHQGHVFDAYPRSEKKLRLRITLWLTNVTASIDIRNPQVHRAASWVGRPVPQTNRIGNTDVVLRELVVRTNGGPKKYWETPARFWEPVFDFRAGDVATGGWDPPEWTAEDPTGNHGKHLGLHQPILKYIATFYPTATNREATTIVAALPTTPTTSFTSNLLWNATFPFRQTNILVVGILPAGVNVFSDSLPVANPGLTAVSGGAPSGWMSQSRAVTPLNIQEWQGHYTPFPTLYVRLPKPSREVRIAVRLRDQQGRYRLARPEPQGSRDDIRPYLIELPADVTTVTPEIVQLHPVTTTFTVATPAARP